MTLRWPARQPPGRRLPAMARTTPGASGSLLVGGAILLLDALFLGLLFGQRQRRHNRPATSLS